MTTPDRPGPTGTGTSMTLLDRILARDEEAWRRVISLYTPLVVYWCRRRGVRPDDAEDVAQEVFRAVAAGIAGFRRDRPGSTFRGWLRGVTIKKALAWHHYQQGQPSALGEAEAGLMLDGQADDPEDDDPGQLADLYRRALELVQGEFEAKTWTAFWRVAVDGHDTADVARDLGISSASVRQAKSRVLRRLKLELGDIIA